MRLSDSIETFIKTLLAEDEPEVELKRNELAEYFGCAPNQLCAGDAFFPRPRIPD